MVSKSNEKLAEYRQRRHFQRTPEPEVREATPHAQPVFVIQQHDASHLHYDFRLESDGVLHSWAIPKGPTTNTRIRRLAIQTEDHPLDYATFEGVIPAGEYGAGTVLVGDYGTYENYSEKNDHPLAIRDAILNGQLSIWLEGDKLHGGYALIRTRFIRGRESWLFIKMHDEWADAEHEIIKTSPYSVLTGRSLRQIADEGRKKAA